MKIILLLEPPFSTISLELEDAATEKKFSYFSLSDIFMSETGGDSDIAKKLQDAKAKGETLDPHFTYRAILEKYLHKVPKNTPNGFVLDPDCFQSAEELSILLEILANAGHPLNMVVDIRVSAEECVEYIEDYQVDEAEGLLEIAEYFEVLYPQALELLKQHNIPIVEMDSEADPRTTYKQFVGLLLAE